MKLQKDALTFEMEKQMHQLQDESEKLVTSLEHAMADLKKEKVFTS